MSASRRARVHARVAEVAGGPPRPRDRGARGTGWPPGRRTPRGPGVRPRCRRRVARGCYAHERGRRAAPRRAGRAWTRTPTPAPRERYDVLMAADRRLPLVGACWPELVADRGARPSTSAGELGDPEPVAPGRDRDHPGRAVAFGAARARSTRRWSRRCARSLDRLPAADGDAALPGDARAWPTSSTTARRSRSAAPWSTRGWRWRAGSTTRRLLLDACQIAFVALWGASTAAERLALAERGDGARRAPR